MSFRLFSISSMYPGSLDTFYSTHPAAREMSYADHLACLVENTTEFVGSYIRNFRKLGIESECMIANDFILQSKWARETGINTELNEIIIFEKIKAYRPDVLLVENLSVVTSSLLESVRNEIKSVRLIIANHCAPFNPKVLDSLTEVDFVFTCTPGLKATIESMGKKSYLIYHGFDTEILKKLKPDPDLVNDLVFSGSLTSGGDFHAKRISLIERILEEKIPLGLYVNLESIYRIRAKQSIYLFSNLLKKLRIEKFFDNIQLLQYGKTWVDPYSAALMRHKKPPLYGLDMFNLFLASKVILNFHIGIAGQYAGNMRMFEVTGVGSCLLTDNKENMDDLFKTGTEVVVYDNADDCIEKAIWLLEHDDERKKIALAGQQRTLNTHTVVDRCRSIIEVINNELELAGEKR
jgi:spore maturation protein CgeB